MTAQTDAPTPTAPASALMTFNEVGAMTGLSRSTLYRYIQLGEFPQPRKVGTRALRFVRAEVDAWLGGIVEEGAA